MASPGDVPGSDGSEDTITVDADEVRSGPLSLADALVRGVTRRNA